MYKLNYKWHEKNNLGMDVEVSEELFGRIYDEYSFYCYNDIINDWQMYDIKTNMIIVSASSEEELINKYEAQKASFVEMQKQQFYNYIKECVRGEIYGEQD